MPQKEDPNRVRIAVGGNIIQYPGPGELTTRTADMRTSKILWNGIIRTRDARYMTGDEECVFLATLMDRKEYLGIAVHRLDPPRVYRFVRPT